MRIELGSGRHAYGQVADEPLMVFFDGTFDEDIAVERVPYLPVAFRTWVSIHVITKGVWKIVGAKPLLSGNAEEPFFFKRDAMTGRLFLYHSTFARRTMSVRLLLKNATVWNALRYGRRSTSSIA